MSRSQGGSSLEELGWVADEVGWGGPRIAGEPSAWLDTRGCFSMWNPEESAPLLSNLALPGKGYCCP